MVGDLADTEEKAASLAAGELISLVDVVTLSPSLFVKSSLLQEAKMKLRQFLFRHDVNCLLSCLVTILSFSCFWVRRHEVTFWGC